MCQHASVRSALWFSRLVVVAAVLGGCSGELGPAADAGSDARSTDTGTADSARRDAGTTDAHGDAGPPIDIGETLFFGFVAIDCNYDDPLDAVARTEYVDEVSDFTNVAHVCAAGPDEDLSTRLARLDDAGLRAILAIESILFESVAGTSRADPTHHLALRADAEARLTRWLARNAAVLDEAHVAALYLVDEPAWNALPMSDLAAAALMLDGASELPLFFVEAGAALDTLTIPAAIDLVGFDRYDTREPSTDATWLGDLDRLVALRTRPEQRIVLVMDTQWRDYYGEAGVPPEGMAGVARSTVEVAASTPEVVGILGYVWPGGLDMPTQLGARELPSSVTDVYREIGAAVRARTP